MSIIRCIDFMMVDLASFFIISAMLKCIAHAVVIIKGISLMYIILMAIATSLCSLSIPFGRLSSVLSTNFLRVLHVFFPFRLPKFGPRMSSACTMSSLVIGQFAIRLFSRYFNVICHTWPADNILNYPSFKSIKLLLNCVLTFILIYCVN